MMDCKTAKEYIDMYVDDMLDDAEKQQLMFHIQSCDQCKKEYDNAMRLKAALSGLDELEPPEGLAQSAIRKARRHKVPSFTYITAAVAAAVALVVVLSSGLFPGQKMHMLERADEAAPQDMAYDSGATEMTKSAEFKDESYMADDAAPAPAGMPEMEAAEMPEEPASAEEPEEPAPAATGEPAFDEPDNDAGFGAGRIYIPRGYEDAWTRLEAFIVENDIEAEYYQDDDKSVVAFIAENRFYNELIALMEELGLGYEYVNANERIEIVIE